jgi:phosphomannomutase
VIPAAAGEQVLDRYRRVARGQPLKWAAHDGFGRPLRCDDPLGRHLGLVLGQVDVERIRGRRFRVLLDVNGGAGGKLGRRLLEELGATVHILGEAPTGDFVHPPEPTAENLAGVQEFARKFDAAVGFCQDPDADRLAILDERGRYIGEEYTLALCLAHVLRRRPGPVVTNCATSRMNEDIAARFGVPFVRASVGEANVVDAMLASKAAFGGEGNGGPIDPEVGLVRDSFVGMALLLDYLAAEGKPLSQLVEALPRYDIHKAKVTLDREQIPLALRQLANHFATAQIDRRDGVRFDWPGRWLLVRASNTEPIVRIIAEAQTRAEAEELGAEGERVMTAGAL